MIVSVNNINIKNPSGLSSNSINTSEESTVKPRITLTKVKNEVVTLTPAQADYHLKSHLFEKQRPLRQTQVDFLANEMRRGSFNPATEITFVDYENKLHLINGQHSLHAIVQAGIPQLVVIKTLTVPTYQDLAGLYSHYDIGDTRRIADMFRAFGLQEDIGLNAQQQKQISSAFNLIANRFFKASGVKQSRVESMQGVRYWAPYAKKYFSIVNHQGKLITDRLKTMCPLALGVITLRFAEQEAQDFWYQVATGDNPNRARGATSKDPAIHLRNFFMMDKQKAALTTKPDTKNTGTKHVVNYIVACWNNFTEKKQVSYIQTEYLEKNFRINRVPDLEKVHSLPKE